MWPRVGWFLRWAFPCSWRGGVWWGGLCCVLALLFGRRSAPWGLGSFRLCALGCCLVAVLLGPGFALKSALRALGCGGCGVLFFGFVGRGGGGGLVSVAALGGRRGGGLGSRLAPDGASALCCVLALLLGRRSAPWGLGAFGLWALGWCLVEVLLCAGFALRTALRALGFGGCGVLFFGLVPCGGFPGLSLF